MKKRVIFILLILNFLDGGAVIAAEGDVSLAIGYQASDYGDLYVEYGITQNISVGLDLAIFFDTAVIWNPMVKYYIADEFDSPYFGAGIYCAVPDESCVGCDSTLIGLKVEAGYRFYMDPMMFTVGYKYTFVEPDSWYDATGPKIELGFLF